MTRISLEKHQGSKNGLSNFLGSAVFSVTRLGSGPRLSEDNPIIDEFRKGIGLLAPREIFREPVTQRHADDLFGYWNSRPDGADTGTETTTNQMRVRD